MLQLLGDFVLQLDPLPGLRPWIPRPPVFFYAPHSNPVRSTPLAKIHNNDQWRAYRGKAVMGRLVAPKHVSDTKIIRMCPKLLTMFYAYNYTTVSI